MNCPLCDKEMISKEWEITNLDIYECYADHKPVVFHFVKDGTLVFYRMFVGIDNDTEYWVSANYPGSMHHDPGTSVKKYIKKPPYLPEFTVQQLYVTSDIVPVTEAVTLLDKILSLKAFL